MRFMRAIAGHTCWDHKTNDDVIEVLQIQPIKQFIDKYQLHWKNHVQQTDRNGIPKARLHWVI